MSDLQDNCKKPSLEDLLLVSQIASCMNSYVAPKPENLKKILGAVDSSKFPRNLPVAILAVIGPKESGKSFLTNLLIQFLKAEGEGGWMTKIVKKGLQSGFSWGSISNQNLFQPGGPAAEKGGVYLWPEPFLLEKAGDRKILVWIMHLDSPHNNEKEIMELERFLTLACSRIMEIQYENNEFRILEHYKEISSRLSSVSTNPITKEEICNSLVYVIRSAGTKAAAGTDEKAKKSILELVGNAGKDKAAFQEVLDKFQHVNLVSMKNHTGQLHNEDGTFNKEATKIISTSIKKVVESMMDESEIVQKKTGGADGLTLGNMEEYLVSAAKKIFSKKLGESGNEEKGGGSEKALEASRAPMNQLNNSKTEIKSNDNMYLSKDMDQLKIGSMESMETKENGGNLVPTVGVQAHQNGKANPSGKEDSQVVPELCKSEESKEDLIPTTPKSKEQAPDSTPKEIHSSNSQVQLPLQPDIPPLSQFRRDWKENRGKFCQLQLTESSEKKVMATASSPPPVPRTPTPPPSAPLKNQITEDEEMDTTPPPESKNTLSSISSSSQPKFGNALVKSKSTELDDTEPMDCNDVEADEAARKLEAEKRENELKLKKEAEKERIKKKEDEERRRKEEQMKADLEDRINRSITQIKQTLPSFIENWINYSLNLSTVSQMETIYAELFKQKTDNHKYFVTDQKLWKEFTARVDCNCKDECIKIIRSVSEPVLKAYRGIKKQFEFHGYLSEIKLEETVAEELRKALIAGEDHASENRNITLATKKLLGIFKDHNSKIIRHETEAYRSMKSEIIEVYHEQMKRYLKDAPYAPQDFQKIHLKLVEKLVDAFRKAFHISKSVNETTTAAEAGDLKKQLDLELSSYKNANDKKLKDCQEAAKKVNKNMKTQYNEKVEDMLKKNSDGLKAEILSQYHRGIVAEVIKLLELEVKSKIREKEPLDEHKKSLQSHIDNYWETVLDVNSKNIKKREEREKEERLQKEKAEAQRKLKEKQDSSKNLFSAAGTSSSWDSPQSHLKASDISSEDKRPSLPPLIFHLQSQSVTMAMCNGGRVDIMQNESGEWQTPAYVVWTKDNRLAYGTEAYAYGSAVSANGNLCWSLEDFFLARDFSWNHVIRVDGRAYEICEEFCLAILLRKLKHAAEQQLKGRCDQALLTIPFWLSSLQRTMVKQGAELAGFSEVYLINEASAAAYHFTISVRSSLGLGESLFLVASEILDRVDVSVYSYSAGSKKLSMVSHASNYGLDDEDDKSRRRGNYLLEKGALLYNYATGLFSSSEPVSQQKNENSSQTVRDACDSAIHRARVQLHCSNLNIYDAVYVCENDGKWRSILNCVANRLPTSEALADNPVINGCAAFTNCLKEMGNFIQDKAAYDVFRLYTKRKGGVKVICKEDVLPPNVKNHNSRLPSCISNVRFGQIVMGTEHTIGELSVNDVAYNQALEPVLSINNEAVVNLRDVLINTRHGNMKSETMANMPKDKIKWTTLNLSEEKFKDLKLLLEKFAPPLPLEDPALTEAKDKLSQKCKEMIQKVETGQFKFKSDLGKSTVLQKIEDARKFAVHENSTLDGVQKQMESLEKLCQRYDKK